MAFRHSHRRRTRRLVTAMATISLVAAGVVAPTTATAEEQYYYVVNQRTNMVAEVFAHSLDEGAWVALWPNYGGDSEQFRKVDRHDGWFWLVAKHSGKCLSRTRDETSTAVVQSACYFPRRWEGDDVRQLWRVRQVRKTDAECSNRNQCFAAFRTVLDNWYKSKCLDAANAKAPAPPAQGTALQTWPCISKFSDWNAVNQEWELVNTQAEPFRAPR